MPIIISPTIPNISINSNTYTHSNWENNTPGTISGIANDISSRITLLELVGVLTKSISGNVTLSGPESTNIGFIFTGALTGAVNINFAAGFEGIALIENQTTGGFGLSCGLVSGARETVPTLGSAAIFCDGTNFKLQSGIVRTSSGGYVSGGLGVGGALTVGTTVTVTGQANFSGDMFVTGVLNTNNDVGVEDNLSVGGSGTFGSFITLVDSLFVVSAAGEANSIVSAISGQPAKLAFRTGALARWVVEKGDVLESGSNVGSNFNIVRYNDAGTVVAIPFSIVRANGRIILNELPISSAGLAVGTLWNDAGTMKIA